MTTIDIERRSWRDGDEEEEGEERMTSSSNDDTTRDGERENMTSER